MAIDKKLQTYLSLLMQQVFGYHHELDKVALIFALDPTHTTIRLRCNKYSEEISEDRYAISIQRKYLKIDFRSWRNMS